MGDPGPGRAGRETGPGSTGGSVLSAPETRGCGGRSRPVPCGGGGCVRVRVKGPVQGEANGPPLSFTELPFHLWVGERTEWIFFFLVPGAGVRFVGRKGGSEVCILGETVEGYPEVSSVTGGKSPVGLQPTAVL